LSALTQNLKEQFSFKSFLIGVAGVVAIYAALFGFAFLKAGSTLEELEARLASQTLFIQETTDVVADETPPAHDASSHNAQPHEEVSHDEDMLAHDAAPLNETDKMPAPETSITEDLAQLDYVESNSHSLVPAPLEELTEISTYGVLPKRSAALTPFKAYKKPFLLNRDKSALAIGILDYGLSEALSKNILAFMPSTVSLILSPYSKDAERWQKIAREDGHEIWLQMGIQSESFPKSDPGSQSFLSGVSFRYNQDKLHWLLSRTTGYAGVAGYTDESFKAGGAMYKNLISELFNRGQGFFEMNPNHAGFVRDAALDGAFPYAESRFLLKNLSADNPQLNEIKETLKAQGGASVLIKPTPKNLKDLKTWISKLERENIQIVPVSALAALTTE
jgi:polysaccharide deacetylase 2 family uncharacterized protein YibQ